MTQKTRDTGGYDFFIEYGGTEYGFILDEMPSEQGGGLMYQAGVVQPLVDQRFSGNMSYEALPTYLTNPVQFESWNGGSGHDDAGENKQSTRNDSYSYSRGVDLSENSRMILSPEVVAVASVGADITEQKYLPSFGLMALAGRYVYQWNTGTGAWVQKLDLGAGHTASDIIEYSNNVGTYCVVADLGDSYQHSTNLSSWSAVAIDVKKFAVRGTTSDVPVLWGVLADGQLKNCIDLLLVGNWSLADRTGNTSDTVNSMWVQNGDLYIGKNTGLTKFDGTNISEIFVNNSFPDDNAFKHWIQWIDGQVYFNWQSRLIQFDAVSNTLTPVFSPRHEELAGDITAVAGSVEYVYFALKNAAGKTYIMKGVPGQTHNDGVANSDHFVWHTYMYRSTNDCNAMSYAPAGEQHANNPTLALHTNASDAEYIILPRPGLRPWEDGNCRFEAAGGFVIGPWSDAGAQAYTKFLNGARFVGESMSSTETAVVAYAQDGNDATYANVITANSNGLTTATLAGTVELTRIQYKVTLSTTGNTATPIVNGFIFDTTPNPPRRQAWTMGAKIGTQTRKRDQTQEKESFQTLRDHLLNGVEAKVTFTDVDGTQYTVKMSDARVIGLRYNKNKGGRRPSLEATMRISIAEIIELEATIGSPFVYGASLWGSGDVWS